MFRITEGRLEFSNNQCLSFPDIGLRHSHLAAPQLKGLSYNEVTSNCLYADINRKEDFFCYL